MQETNACGIRNCKIKFNSRVSYVYLNERYQYAGWYIIEWIQNLSRCIKISVRDCEYTIVRIKYQNLEVNTLSNTLMKCDMGKFHSMAYLSLTTNIGKKLTVKFNCDNLGAVKSLQYSGWLLEDVQNEFTNKLLYIICHINVDNEFRIELTYDNFGFKVCDYRISSEVMIDLITHLRQLARQRNYIAQVDEVNNFSVYVRITFGNNKQRQSSIKLYSTGKGLLIIRQSNQDESKQACCMITDMSKYLIARSKQLTS